MKSIKIRKIGGCQFNQKCAQLQIQLDFISKIQVNLQNDYCKYIVQLMFDFKVDLIFKFEY